MNITFLSFMEEFAKIAVATPKVKVADATGLGLAIGGALGGGELASRGSRKFLKGRYATPLVLGGSLIGSHLAQKPYYKYKQRKRSEKIRRMRSRVANATPEERAYLRSLSKA
jgi:uncharacterized membrane protein YebE (DUF533 family)